VWPLSDNLGKRRSIAQDGPSGLRAVAGAVVSDVGGGEQPTAEASAPSTLGSPSARTRNAAFALAGPMPSGTRAIEGHPRPHARAYVWRPSRGLEMWIAQADSTLMARSQESRWSTGSTR